MHIKRISLLCLFILFISCGGQGGNGGSGGRGSSSSSSTSQVELENVAVYYGWLNSLNSASLGWNNDNVVTFMSQYDIFVVGDGIQDAGHGDYANTSYIIPRVEANNTKVFGYISIGNTFNHSMADLKVDVDE